MAHDKDDRDDLQTYFDNNRALDEHLAPVLTAVNDASPDKQIDFGVVADQLSNLQGALQRIDPFAHERQKVEQLVQETAELLKIASQGDIERLETFVKNTRHLFRGTNGIGMTYYAGYRPAE